VPVAPAVWAARPGANGLDMEVVPMEHRAFIAACLKHGESWYSSDIQVVSVP